MRCGSKQKILPTQPDEEPRECFESYPDIRHAGEITRLIADLLTLDEEKRISAVEVEQRYAKWLGQ